MSRISWIGVLVVLGLFTSMEVHAASVTRGPYLQLQTESGITVRWRTDMATDSVVRYGATPGNLDQSVQVAGLRTEHRVVLTGLATGQKYYYSVGDSNGPIAGDASYHFHTAPVSGVPADTRFWVLGDSGTANADARSVRDAFAAWSSSDPADFWLMLGDNAYNDGTDAEYQAAVFNIYPETLRQLPLWSTLGNHDGHSADSTTQSGPYYDIFDFPTAGEAGGWPSGTEAYYSFDYANIHFVNLDSYDSNRAPGGAMLQWLEADLATNTQPWVIAFWHHPPYTKGSHNSDTEGGLIDMRNNALPLLEAWGVDLVMTGHSHTYERSYLIDGHYGLSSSWNAASHGVDLGDGRPTGDGAYQKPGIIAAENMGAVYAVAGSSGKVSVGYPLNHPAMLIALEKLGSMVIDVSGNQLDAVFLDETGTVQDSFSIIKTPDSDPPLISGARAEDANHVVVDFNEPVSSLEAADTANYSIAGLSISNAELLVGARSVRLETSAMADGTGYTLAISNVRDLIGNTILPGSTVDFDYFNFMELSFQDGLAPTSAYAGTSDSYIRQASPTTNYGAATSLQVDGDEPANTGTDMSILLGWDLSAIPVNATVEAAELVLEVTNVSAGVYQCFGLERAWTESQVTWNLASSGISWGSPGATAASDRNNAPLCSINAGSLGSLVVPLNADGIARLQSWISNPAGNYGMVIASPSTTDGADFHSSESATAMARPRLNVIYRVDAAPPNNPPTADFSVNCEGLQCSFADASFDPDGTLAAHLWDFGDGATSTAPSPTHDFAAAGDYLVTLTVTDDDGVTGQLANTVSVSEPPPPPFIDQFAQADLFTDGSSTGTFLDTHTDNDVAQALTERESGGKKNQRHSYLAHTWQFSVAPGSAVMVQANAWSGGSADGDAFNFAWSSDNSNFQTLFTVTSTDPGNMQGAPIPTSGTIYIRVTDTNQQAGNSALDTVFIDQLFIRSENGTPPPNQAPSADFSFSCNGLACDFTNTSGDVDGSIVSRSWDFGDGASSTTNSPSHSFATENTWTVTLTVTDDDGATNQVSKSVTVSAASTIALSASGYKVKGINTADLSWSGAAGGTVRILRDGSSVGTTANDGLHTDTTGDKGGRSYVYQVCEALPSTQCSNEVTLVF